ncbi:exo-alpha-sialidase [Vibrio parahaemolyticus]|nr:exo-alpha-sialidase [Vibrio parahaemolyticus]EGR2836747.1 exo-alpha-sialidase [Vibrio parahaemolyticus]
MTQNIEQRTNVAVTKYEGAANKVEEIASKDKDVLTNDGVRKSFPKISREWNEESNRLQTEWKNDSTVIREDWQNERNELSTKALGVKPWESGQSEGNINQQRRWTDNHTYLPKSVPVLMDLAGPNDDWIPYTADKSDTLKDVFGRKPVDLYSGLVITPDASFRYPKLSAYGKLWELKKSNLEITVNTFNVVNGSLIINDVIIANESIMVTETYNENENNRRQSETVGEDVAQLRVGITLNGQRSLRFVDDFNELSVLYYVKPARNGVVERFDLEKRYIVIDGYYSRLDSVSNYTDKKNISSHPFKPRNLQYFNNNLHQEVTEDNDKENDSNGEDIYYYGPTTTILPSGRIITAYTVKHGHDIDPGQIEDTRMTISVKISDDNGKSYFSKNVVDKPAPYQCSESNIIFNPDDNKIYIFYTSMRGQLGWGYSQKGTDEYQSSQIEYVTSCDNGDTWSTPINITSKIKPDISYFVFTPPTKAIVNKRGRMMVPLSYLEGLDSGIVETYIYNDGEDWYVGETIAKENDSTGIGNTGGELGFGLYPDGSVFAISRTYYDDPELGYRVAIQKLIVNINDEWIIKGAFKTSDCKSSWVTLSGMNGFDGFKLLIAAPIGQSENLEGRKNIHLFDASDDFSNPIDLGVIYPDKYTYAGYSSLSLMANGCLLLSFDGRAWKVHMSSFTLNKLRGSQGEQVPCYGVKLVENLSGDLHLDVSEHEIVHTEDVDDVYVYRFSKFHNKKVKKEEFIQEYKTTLNANESDVFYFKNGSGGSIIKSIEGGYTGQEITLLSESSSIEVYIERLSPGAGQYARIMFSDSVNYTNSGAVTFSKLKIMGGTSIYSHKLTLLKTEYGWYSNQQANYE